MKKLEQALYRLYVGIGTVAMALLAFCVMFTVIMRYCFSLNWKEVAEFGVTLFAFTTFWGMGINVLRDEHVVIDILFDRIRPAVKRWVAVFNYVVVLAVVLVFTYFSWIYTLKAGMQLSMGMEIPMRYMYGIMPLCGVLCAVCVVLRIIGFLRAPVEAFAPKNTPPEKGDAKP